MDELYVEDKKTDLEQEVKDLNDGNLEYYLDLGVDGFRFDAIKYIYTSMIQNAVLISGTGIWRS